MQITKGLFLVESTIKIAGPLHLSNSAHLLLGTALVERLVSDSTIPSQIEKLDWTPKLNLPYRIDAGMFHWATGNRCWGSQLLKMKTILTPARADLDDVKAPFHFDAIHLDMRRQQGVKHCRREERTP